MRAMTLHQPWATLIAEGIKTIETRGRRSPWHTAVGETIAIHASVKRSRFGIEISPTGAGLICTRRPGEARLWRSLGGDPEAYGYDDDQLPLGAVVATATVDAVVPMAAPQTPEVDNDQVLVVRADGPLGLYLEPRHMPGGIRHDVTGQRPFGDFAPGRWAILLSDVRKLDEPQPCRGYQGLWTVPTENADRLTA